MRDLNKIAEKMTALWSGGKFHKVKPVKKAETTDEQIAKAMKQFSANNRKGK